MVPFIHDIQARALEHIDQSERCRYTTHSRLSTNEEHHLHMQQGIFMFKRSIVVRSSFSLSLSLSLSRSLSLSLSGNNTATFEYSVDPQWARSFKARVLS